MNRNYYNNRNYYKDDRNLTKGLSFRFIKYLFNENDFIHDSELKKIKLDSTSLYSITPYKFTIIITDLIEKHFGTTDLTITDACACIGGDTISFCKKFKKVNAIELCPDRFYFLSENLKLYNFKNYTIYNDDCLKRITELKQDVIFCDFPWGGKGYKHKKEVDLYLGGISSSEICNRLQQYTKMIVLKVPNNFIFEKFKEEVNFTNFNKYDLEKFQLIIIS